MGGRKQSGSEVTMMEVEDLLNECVRETEGSLNNRLIGNHKEVNKGCYRKIIFICGNSSSCFGIFLVLMELFSIISHCIIVSN